MKKLFVAPLVCFLLSGHFAAAQDGEVIDARSFGWEDHHGGVPSDAETMYRWASLAKPLTSPLETLLRALFPLPRKNEVRR